MTTLFYKIMMAVALLTTLTGVVATEFAPSFAYAQNAKYALLAPLPGVSADCPAGASAGQVCTTDFLTYLGGILKLAISISAVLAVVMITYGGFKYVLAASFGQKSAARETIEHAVIGLILALTSYIILNTINPNLTILKFGLSTSAGAPSAPATQTNGTPGPCPGPTCGQ